MKPDKRAQRTKTKIQNPITAKTEHQKDFIRSIVENDITFGLGSAGVGKSHVAIGIACEHLLSGKTTKIVVTRPFVETGRGLGFLAGQLETKLMVWTKIFDQYFTHFLTKEVYESYKALGVIVFEPLEYMRGRDFSAYMILDEAQNATYEQLKMFLSRLAQDAKAIVIGDESQSDLRKTDINEVVNRVKDVEGVGVVRFTAEDICRHDIVGRIIRALT